jgi:hypothetical protein
MTTRFCPGCQAEVQDTGGFCLLGHRLALEAPVASLKALREEVEGSFEGSEHLAEQLDAEPWDQVPEPVLASTVASVAATTLETPVVPSAAAAAPVREAPVVPTRRMAPPPPPPPPRVGPPPPPPPPVLPPNPASPAPSRPSGRDPIADFAPAPRMDWGPEKARLKRLRRRNREAQ